jgi:cytochrome c peroxidase
MKKKYILPLTFLITLLSCTAALAALTQEQKLGKLLYFDRFLSANQNQSCATCHEPAAGFADPLNLRLPDQFPTSAGSDTSLFGGRNAPTAAYAMFSPVFGFDAVEGLYIGGQFWDGRAPTLDEQAKGPFLNPVEMAMADEAAVIVALIDPNNQNALVYQALFNAVYSIDLATTDTSSVTPGVTTAYNALAMAIAAFERAPAFARFNSKFDAVMAGAETFTPAEANGWTLFNGTAQCHLCHPAPIFTDFSYDNLGIPHSKSDLIKKNDADLGLGAIVGDPLENGKFKVSTLRNIALTPPYGHNGFFATMKDIVHFYNTRDVQAEKWDKPEVPENVNVVELGNLGLTDLEENDLVAFLKTLTDRKDAMSFAPVP